MHAGRRLTKRERAVTILGFGLLWFVLDPKKTLLNFLFVREQVTPTQWPEWAKRDLTWRIRAAKEQAMAGASRL